MARIRIRNLILMRVRIAFAVMTLFALLITYRIAVLQFVQGDDWESRAVGLKHQVVTATRGSIYADDGSLLAASLPYYRLVLDPTVSDELLFNTYVDSLAMGLSAFFGEDSPENIAQMLKKARIQRKKYLRLGNREISFQEKKQISQLPILREGRRKGGLIFERSDRRVRPFGSLARRTIGFMQSENEAIPDSLEETEGRGLEYSFNPILGGVNGEALYQKIAGGYWIPLNDGTEVRPKDGLDIHTTLDLYLQDTAQTILRRQLQKYRADYGALLLMEVKTGALKAVVNLGRNSQGDYVENNNYAIGMAGLAEPGSTFKLMSMVALFEDAPVTLLDTVDTGNGVYQFFEDAVMRDVSPYGKITIQEVFEKSSNVGMSKLIWKYFRKNPERFVSYLRKFQLHQPLNAQLVGEARPLIKDPNDGPWSGSTLPWMSIGYETLLSPLHTLTFYNAIANGGQIMQPYLVKAAAHANRTEERFDPKPLGDPVCSKNTLEIVQRMLESSVKSGTAQNIYTDTYRIAGKTGTAEKVKDGKYTQDHYTSFVGYFPANDPQYSCIVVIDDPKHERDRYGAQIAAPVFREFADVVYHQRVHPKIEDLQASTDPTLPLIQAGKKEQLETICQNLGIAYHNVTPLPWVRTEVRNDSIFFTDLPLSDQKIPNTVGMTLRDALYVLENHGLNVTFVGRGRVAQQSIPPGQTVKAGQTIVLQLK
ncbi:MAG: penicillin-binding protein [Bernardetiaceae bacterium]